MHSINTTGSHAQRHPALPSARHSTRLMQLDVCLLDIAGEDSTLDQAVLGACSRDLLAEDLYVCADTQLAVLDEDLRGVRSIAWMD